LLCLWQQGLRVPFPNFPAEDSVNEFARNCRT
jgi:hypothetical protein